MANIDDYDFEGGDADAGVVENSEAGQIRVGGYIVIRDRPCKVSAVSTSKTGKHGHAKCNFVAIDIFTGKKLEDIIPSTHNAHVPFVVRGEYSIIDIDADGFITMMDDQGTSREDVKLPTWPDSMAMDMQKAFDDGKNLVCTVMSAMKHEQVVAWKEESEK